MRGQHLIRAITAFLAATRTRVLRRGEDIRTPRPVWEARNDRKPEG